MTTVPRKAHWRWEEGFGLIELLVAMTVLTVALLGLFAAYSSSYVALRRAPRMSSATLLADSRWSASARSSSQGLTIYQDSSLALDTTDSCNTREQHQLADPDTDQRVGHRPLVGGEHRRQRVARFDLGLDPRPCEPRGLRRRPQRHTEPSRCSAPAS
jgi:prepilin-type N-terminal cleavage/methylation domain-containing protein